MIARILVSSALVVAAPAVAADTSAASLKQCRAIGDGAARLACYDALADKLRGDVKPFDPVASFGGRGEAVKPAKGEQLDRLTAKITSAHIDANGLLRFTIDAGSSWRQSESKSIGIEPKAGDPIELRRGSLGSYVAILKSGRSIRVLRVR